MNRLIAACVVLCASVASGQSKYERDILSVFNAERLDANRRELAIYGTVLAWREPLGHDQRLTDAAKLWLQLLPKNELNHSAPVSSLTDPTLGELIDVNGDGWLSSFERRLWCGYTEPGTELAALANFAQRGRDVAAAWVRSGYSIDPRQADGHYAELIDPRFHELGAASDAGAAGKRRAVCELGEGGQ